MTADAPRHELSDEEIVAMDLDARRIIREWHRHPAIAGLLTYRGVPLGDATEFHSANAIMTALLQVRTAAKRQEHRAQQ